MTEKKSARNRDVVVVNGVSAQVTERIEHLEETVEVLQEKVEALEAVVEQTNQPDESGTNEES